MLQGGVKNRDKIIQTVAISANERRNGIISFSYRFRLRRRMIYFLQLLYEFAIDFPEGFRHPAIERMRFSLFFHVARRIFVR
jgi:hypothetical protein